MTFLIRRLLTGLLALLLGAGVLVVPTMASAAASGPGDGGPAIIGGGPASPGEYPHMVALLSAGISNPYYAQFCGGSVIASTFVLTAAHCVEGETPNSVDVLVGTNTLSSGGDRIGVNDITIHPSYNPNLGWDFAVLELDSPTAQTPVELGMPAQSAYWTPGTTATVTGWGNMIFPGPSYPDDLQEVDVPVVSDGDCVDAYPAGWVEADNMICAGLLGIGGKDSCGGDSGGPMIVDGPSGPLQVGVVSWGIDCAAPAYPGVYSEVPAAETWISSIVGSDPGGDEPVIDLVSPSSGPTSGGSRVTVTGSDFTGATSVTVGGVEAPKWKVRNDGQIRLTTPAGTAGPADLVVTTPAGTGTATFTYEGGDPGGAPDIDGVSPSSGQTSGGTKVTVTGSDFTGATSVTVGGVEAPKWKVRNDGQIRLSTPAGTAGPADLVVTTPLGSDSATFTYT